MIPRVFELFSCWTCTRGSQTVVRDIFIVIAINNDNNLTANIPVAVAYMGLSRPRAPFSGA